eukprot:15147255-Alexandrium_andersonii.AAC.1
MGQQQRPKPDRRRAEIACGAAVRPIASPGVSSMPRSCPRMSRLARPTTLATPSPGATTAS